MLTDCRAVRGQYESMDGLSAAVVDEDGTRFMRQHLIDPEMCARCNSCAEVCPRTAILHDGCTYAVDAERCEACGQCLIGCSTGAIDNWRVVLRGSPYSVAEQLTWARLPAPLPMAPRASALDVLAETPAHFARPMPPPSATLPALHRFDRDHPAEALICSNQQLTDRAADGSAIHHIVLELAPHELPVLEGQSIGVLTPGCDELGRPHHVRLYSAASAREGEVPGTPTLALTVRRVLQDHEGRPVRGVCSNYLCDLPSGARVQITGPVGETFLMPEARGASLLMICTGTGIAPMRAMIQRRLRRGDAERAGLMLFFGGRSPSQLPYRQEFAAIPASQLDCTIAYSRRPGEAKRYVQDSLRERGSEVARMILERQATVYVCGLKSMEHGVHEALRQVLSAAGADWEHISRQLTSSGRYHVEVY